jgi:hypothetical protein
MSIKSYKVPSCLVDISSLKTWNAYYTIDTSQATLTKTALVHQIRPVSFTPFTISTNIRDASSLLNYTATMSNGDPLLSFLSLSLEKPDFNFDLSTFPKKGPYKILLFGNSAYQGIQEKIEVTIILDGNYGPPLFDSELVPQTV